MGQSQPFRLRRLPKRKWTWLVELLAVQDGAVGGGRGSQGEPNESEFLSCHYRKGLEGGDN